MNEAALATVLQRAETERDQALAAWRRADEQARHAQAQADQLAAYRADYEARWQAQFGAGGGIEIVRCYGDFMQRLEQALAQQAQHAGQAAAHAGRLRERSIAAELRVAAIRKLLERRAADQARTLARREQRQGDEHAQQAHRRNALHS
jgi:flagellar FliJ protein